MASRRAPAAETRPRATRKGRARPAARPAPQRWPWRRILRIGSLAGIGAVALVIAAREITIVRMITWYLAVDQYGYLAFAHDLLHGRVFNHWPPLDAFGPSLPPRIDILFQTYVWDHGRAYCRYAPGFPILLAAWIGVFGDDGAHHLNPVAYAALLAVAFAFQARVFRSTWWATVGTALIAYFPTYMDWWALTLVRDVPTHLCGLLGLFLLLPVRGRPLTALRTGLAGLAFGYGASMRPDAIIYLVPALLLAATRWEREGPGLGLVARGLGGGALGVLVGVTPLLLYNWAATGSPFRLTQGMEIEGLLGGNGPAAAPAPAQPPTPPAAEAGKAAPRVGFPSEAWASKWVGGTGAGVQGGGFRLTNLPKTLPKNWAKLRQYYGDLFVGLAVWGAVLAFFQRRMLFASGVIYALMALLFFSCWVRADPRYQIGIYVFLPMLAVEGGLGTLALVRRLARRQVPVARLVATALAVAVAAGWWMTTSQEILEATDQLVWIVAPLLALAAIAAAVWPRAHVAALAAPLVAAGLVGYACWYAAERLAEPPARFQRPEMLRARQAFNAAVEPRAVVITSEEIGRPAENIDYYSGVARALYFTDLKRWGLEVPQAADLLTRAGFVPYLLIPVNQADRAQMLQDLAVRWQVDQVASIPAARAMEFFVAASFHRGMHLELYRLKPLPS